MSIASSAPHRAGSVASVGASASGLSVYYSYLHDGTLSPLAGTGEMVSPFWAKRRELGLHGARGKEIIKLRALLHSVVVDWFELTVSEKSRNVLKTIKLSSRRLRWLRAHCLQQFAGYVQKRRRSRRLQRLGESAARRAAQRLLQVSLSLSLSECVSFVLSLSRARIRARAHAHKAHVCIDTSRTYMWIYMYAHMQMDMCVQSMGQRSFTGVVMAMRESTRVHIAYICTLYVQSKRAHTTCIFTLYVCAAELHGRGQGHAPIDRG